MTSGGDGGTGGAVGPPPRRLVRHVEADAPAHLIDGTRWRGVLALVNGAPALELWARAGGDDVRVTWGLPSPRIEHRFPRAANPATARFEVVLPAPAGQVELVLRRPGGTGPGTVVATFGTDLAPSGVSAAPAVAAGGEAGIRDVVEAAVRRGTLTPDEFATVDRALGAVPLADRDVAWLRQSVLAMTLARERPRVVLAQLGELRERADPAEFEEVWGTVDVLLGPLALTPSGYHEALRTLGDEQFFAELRDLLDLLDGLGLTVFLNSGTLLGAVREGRPLGHDYDADLGVLLPAVRADEVVPMFWNVKQRLREAGLLNEDYETHRHHCRVQLASGVPVDLFPAWAHDDRLHVWPWADGELPVSALVPLGSLELQGRALPVPADPEAVLGVNYGEGWREFDPTFAFDWARARERHAEFVGASHARWEAERARTRG